MARAAQSFVTYLSAAVDPNALTVTSNFERQIESAFKRIDEIGKRTSLSVGGGLDPKLNSQINQAASSYARAGSAASQAGSAARGAAADVSLLGTAFERSSQALRVVDGPLGGIAGRLGSLGGIFRSLAGFSLASVLGGGGAFAIGKIATDYANVTDRLRPFFDSQQKLNGALMDVQRIANDTRQPLDAIAELYARITVYGKEAGIQGAKVGQVTELAAKAARISGGSADIQQRGLVQFNQALGRGTLNGQDLRALLEDIPQLGKAIADGLNVPVGKLRELGAQGELTSKVITQALLRSSDEINTQFDRLPVRIGQAFTVVGNNLSVFFGQLDEATGTTDGLARIVLGLGNNIGAVVAGTVALLAAFNAKTFVSQVENAAGAIGQITRANATVQSLAGGQGVGPKTSSFYESRQTSLGAQAGEQDQARQQLAGRLADLDAQKAQEIAARQAIADAGLSIETKGAADRLAVLKAELVQREAIEDESAGRLQTLIRAQPLLDSRAAAPTSDADAGYTSANSAANLAALTEEQGVYAKSVVATAGAVRQLTAAQAQLDALLAGESTEALAALSAADAEIATTDAARVRTRLALNAVEKEGATTAAALAEVNTGLAASEEAEAAAAIEAAGSIGLLSTAQRLAVGVGSTLKSGLGGIVGFLGGPWGVAFSLAAVATGYLVEKTNEATTAAENFVNTGGADLQKRLQNIGLAAKDAAAQTNAFNYATAQGAISAAKTKSAAAQSDLGSTLAAGVLRGGFSSQDKSIASDLISKLGSGTYDASLGGKDYAALAGLFNRNKSSFKADTGLSGYVESKLGTNPGDLKQSALGAFADQLSVSEAQKALDDSKSKLGSNSGAPLLGPKAPSAAILEAQAKAASDPAGSLQQVKAQAQATIIAARAAYEASDKGADAQNTFKAAVQGANQSVVAATAAERAHRAELSAASKELRQHVADVKAYQAASDALTKTLDQVSGDSGSVSSSAKQAAGQRDDIGKDFSYTDRAGNEKEYATLLDKTTGALITKQQALDKVNAAEGQNAIKPLTDELTAEANLIAQDRLRAQGLGDQADLLQKIDTIQKGLGTVNGVQQQLSADQISKLQQNLALQRQINDQADIRNKLIDVYADDIASVQGDITDLLSGKSIGSVFKSLQQQFRQSIAKEITLKIFGDPEKAFRDDMTKGLNTAGDNLTTSATNLNSAAAALAAVGGTTLSGVASAASPAAGGFTSFIPGISDANDSLPADQNLAGDLRSSVSEAFQQGIDDTGNRSAVGAPSFTNPIDVTGAAAIAVKVAKSDSVTNALPKNTTDAFSKIFANDGTSIAKGIEGLLGHPVGGTTGADGATIATTKLEKTLGSVGSKLGTALGGAQTGAEVASLAKSVGFKKFSTTGSEVGGAAGAFLPIPGGALIGSVVGGIVGSLFKTVKFGTASINQSGSVSTSGNKGSLNTAASADASSVASGIDSVVTSLGGAAGNYNVSIGTYGDGPDKYRVSANGSSGALGGSSSTRSSKEVTGFATEDEAVQAAILDAIDQGAVKGIKQGAINLLKAGQDLDTQLAKAVKFQNVFTSLKSYLDPVGAAVDALNTQFSNLIDIFNEAGASSSDFAQLEQLYTLQRADAIKQATDQATSAITDFVTGLTSGSSSPLNKKQTYDNALASVNTFRSDIASGKVVDQNDLVTALGNFNDASRSLNGSDSSYFSDYNDILSLASSAKSNALAGVTDPASADYASPFDTSTIVSATSDQTTALTTALETQTAQLSAQLSAISQGISDRTSGTATAASSIAGLAYYSGLSR